MFYYRINFVVTDNTFECMSSDWLRQLHTSYMRFKYIQSILVRWNSVTDGLFKQNLCFDIHVIYTLNCMSEHFSSSSLNLVFKQNKHVCVQYIDTIKHRTHLIKLYVPCCVLQTSLVVSLRVFNQALQLNVFVQNQYVHASKHKLNK